MIKFPQNIYILLGDFLIIVGIITKPIELEVEVLAFLGISVSYILQYLEVVLEAVDVKDLDLGGVP